MIYAFQDLTAEQQTQAGGKGGTLAKLYQKGYPVPDGFVILPMAFTGTTIQPNLWPHIQTQLTRLRSDNGRSAFAVRSSARSEDSATASFAGEFETVLDVKTDEAVEWAIKKVHQSGQSERVAAYSQAQGLNGRHEIAVVVQRLVQAELSGVLFTADPITGSRQQMSGNFIQGLGDRLVSGEINPETFTLKRPKGSYEGSDELKKYGRSLFRLASQLEEDLGGPQDIEWAIANGKLYILQARPITTLQANNPLTGEWNDSYTGDYLWANTNFGEALPDVMTPFTWSVMQTYFQVNGLGTITDRLPMGGNIAGRLYVNVSLFISVTDALGLPRRKMLRSLEEMFGRLPDDLAIPTVPLSRWWVLRTMAPTLFKRIRVVKGQKKRVPAFIAEAPATVQQLTADIQATSTTADLLHLWQEELQNRLEETCQMLAAGTSDYKNLSRRLHIALEKIVGDADANALLTGAGGQGELASLGPLLGLTQLANGQINRQTYVQRYGHRGPHELEFSHPRPAEDPTWIEQQMTQLVHNPVNVQSLLVKQQAQHQAAWERFIGRYPRRAMSYRQQLDRLAAASRLREAARSEVVRMFGVFRAFALRAGELTGLGEDVFFLSVNELIEVLTGNQQAVAFIPARRETYARYSALPSYPAIINGRFDPFVWAKDPNRRSDIFNPLQHSTFDMPHSVITGFAGASGIVEGPVRRLDSPNEGHLLQPGEILVTTTTNIGWTPLFPRATAIITDIGAPLSHAAIVARELGIPAVVGCGTATTRLKTGDRVRVNGGVGTVEILDFSLTADT